MPDTTTGTPDNGSEENWEQRYLGLQKVVAKRDEALNTSTAALDALRAEKEAADLELAVFRQKAIDATEEETAKAQYEALRTRFEPESPTPVGNSPMRDWLSGNSGRDHANRERTGTSAGFPT